MLNLDISPTIHDNYSSMLSPGLNETLVWQKQDWLRSILDEVEMFFTLKYQ